MGSFRSQLHFLHCAHKQYLVVFPPQYKISFLSILPKARNAKKTERKEKQNLQDRKKENGIKNKKENGFQRTKTDSREERKKMSSREERKKTDSREIYVENGFERKNQRKQIREKEPKKTDSIGRTKENGLKRQTIHGFTARSATATPPCAGWPRWRANAASAHRRGHCTRGPACPRICRACGPDGHAAATTRGRGHARPGSRGGRRCRSGWRRRSSWGSRGAEASCTSPAGRSRVQPLIWNDCR